MHKRSIGILLVISMLMGFHVRAAADETTNTFTVINTNPATVYQLYANDSARSGIWYPAHNRSLETFADSEFSNGYTFMQNGVNGANTWDNNALQFLFDTPAFGENYQLQPYDVVYFSFYYKNASSFEMNGTTYNGTNEPANFHVKLGGENSKGRAMYNINSRDKAVPNRATSKLYCPSDDEWHKAEVAYMVSASLTDAQKQYITDYTAGKMLFTIDFTSSAEPMKIQFSDFTIGLMKFDPSAYTAETQSAYCTEARAVTELGKILERKTGLRALNCEGYDIPVVDENGEMLETLSIPMASENAEISIAAANPALHYLSNNGGNAYTLHVFSPGYDRTKADDAVKTYLAFTDLTANGITGSSCNAGLYHRAETANGALNQRFSVNIVPVFKLFDASEVVHNTTSDSRDVTIDFSKGYNRSIETFDDGLKGYSMRFLKNDGTKGTVSEDNNYLQFDFDIGDYALKKNDTVFYTFYIRADGDGGGEGYVTKLSYSHIQNGERIKMFMGTNSYYIVSSTFSPTIESAKIYGTDTAGKVYAYVPYAGNGWHKVMLAFPAFSDAKPCLRIGGIGDAINENLTVSVADMKMGIYRYPDTICELEKANINVIRRTLGEIAGSTGIYEIQVGDTAVPVVSGTNDYELIKDGITAEDLVPKSRYGDYSYSVEQTGFSTYKVKVYGFGYSHTLSDTDTSAWWNRRVASYTYSDGTTSAVWDASKGQPTSIAVEYAAEKTVANGSLYSEFNITVTPPIAVRMFLDGNQVEDFSQGLIAGTDSEYSVTVTGVPEPYSLFLAAYDTEKEQMVQCAIGAISGGEGTVKISGIDNSNNVIEFRLFMWKSFSDRTPVVPRYRINAGGMSRLDME